MNPQLKKGVLELCVLSQLTKEDKYGYELTDAISREMSIAAGTLYMILKRLKEAGYVETYLQESASGPARKYYHLTEAGTAYQQEKKQEWLDFTQQINRLISEKRFAAACNVADQRNNAAEQEQCSGDITDQQTCFYGVDDQHDT